MSVKIIIFSFLLAQSSASFFDEFRGAMWSVENSFGKLLTDVVTDVRDTIGCTILAVKQVLALGGIFHESSEYDSRCRGTSDTSNSYFAPPNINNNYDPANSYIQETQNSYEVTQPFIFTTPSVDVTPNQVRDVTEKSFAEKVSDEINESVQNVNRTMFELIGKSDTHKKIEKVTNSLISESDRLTKISSLLHRELNDMSEDVKIELKKVDPDTDHPTVHDIWSNIRALHDVELKHSNTHEAAEVHHILDEVLSALRGYTYESGVEVEIVDQKETNNTYLQLRNQFLKMEHEEHDLNIVEDMGQPDLNDDEELKEKEIPRSFKDIAMKIMTETSRTLSLEEDPSEYEELSTSSTEGSLTTIETYEEIIEDPLDSPEYAAIFQIPKDSDSRKKAALDAHKLIENSKQTDAIMNSYFQKTQDIGTSVFDDPDLFNFG